MRKTPEILLSALLIASAFVSGARADVILSELCDPQNDYETDRFIEIFNTGPNPVNLSGWTLVAIANGGDAMTWNLSGTLNVGEAKVAGGASPGGFTVHFVNPAWHPDISNQGSYNWNGQAADGAKLLNSSAVIVDLAFGLAFTNADMVRNSNVTSASPTFSASEWTVTPVTLATQASPGTHNGSTPPALPIRISNLAIDPAVPAASTPVHVQASAVDPAGALTSVSASWGTSSGSLPNSIPMSVVSDSTYRTNAAIPGQAPGVTIYYRVLAAGPSGNAQSSLGSYAIPSNPSAPSILSVGQMSDSTLLVFFSEPVEETSAEVPTSYAVGALTGVNAVRDFVRPEQVLVTIRNIPPGTRTLTVNGVADLDGAIASGATRTFPWIDVSIPAGYYASTVGLSGSALRVALHNRIRNHTVQSYSYLLTAFETSDRKPNGRVWDMYSDVPNGTPPYEYEFGETGQGAGENLGYNREHSWPRSWFNEASPMESDLGHIYPTDSYVNGVRGSYPFGEVGTADYTSQNGSKRGSSVSPGYSGTVFEPIDAYKGDLARAQFYMATRYFGQDGSWLTTPIGDGVELFSWAVEQYQQWSVADPPSWKERLRNGAMYVIQGNRNPFIDHPEFLALIYDSTEVVGVESESATPALVLRASAPNPFRARTTIAFDLPRLEQVRLRIFDVAGRQVRTFLDGRALGPGTHAFEWDGRDDSGKRLDAGLYFARLDAAEGAATRRIVFAP